ncbi:MAG: hypothetical protein ACE5D0_09635 [Fidelibacterota bacterium]
MSPKHNPSQLSIFPELSGDVSSPSIATIPEFDKALGNLIKMSDLGAFIQINIHGIDKSYSLNLNEIQIPPDFLQKKTTSITVHLFSNEIKNDLKNLTYDLKSFFNPGNSFNTSFGYFLFRSHFPLWKSYLKQCEQTINDYISTTLGKGVFGHYFLNLFQKGYSFIKDSADVRAPWVFRKKILLKDIQELRHQHLKNGATISSLIPTDLDYPFQLMVLKTAHIPMVLHQYQAQVHVHSVFKTIHLDYLVDIEINTIEDVRKLTKKLK